MLEQYLIAINVIINYFPIIFLGYILYAKKFRISIPKLILLVLPILIINIFVIVLLYSRGTLSTSLDIMIFLGFSAILLVLFCSIINEGLPSKVFLFLILTCYSYIVKYYSSYFQVGLFDTADEVFRLLSLNLLAISLISITMPLLSHVLIKYVFTTFAQANKSLFKYMWIIPAFALIILTFLEMYAPKQIVYTWQYFILLLCFLCIMLITYIIFFTMLKLSNKNQTLTESIEKTNMLIEMQTKRYTTLTDSISEARIARHDMKHHLKIMSGMLEKGKLDELDNYLSNYRDALPQSDEQISRNFAIDCLLRYYYTKAAKSGIKINSAVNLPELLFISDSDLSVLIGNIVENAIDATLKVTEVDKCVSVKIDYIADQLVIAVDNPYIEVIKTQNGNFFSSKRNYAEFGIGIYSMRTIVEKYFGFMNISQKNNIFSVDIIINSNAKTTDVALFT